MITSITLKHFRNFSDRCFSDFEMKNFIIGKNGQGKTNTLEALALLGSHSILQLPFEDLVALKEEYFFIEVIWNNTDKYSIFFDKNTKKKQYSINGKKVSKKKYSEQGYKTVIFSPIIMNMFYLSPSLRRDFLDTILTATFPEFGTIKKNYNQVLKSRNATLKAIRDKNASREDLIFWNNKCIEFAELYYKKRFLLIEFFEKNIGKITKFLNKNLTEITFLYQTKVHKQTIREDMEAYFIENQERDIYIGSTHIGPHRDDFYISVNHKNITHFASRGEIKSIIIYLKLLEGVFIENISKKKPILLIDDFLSELDSEHKSMLLENISYYQTFISNIEDSKEEGKIIKL